MIETNITQLKINRLTKEQYEAAKKAGTLNSNELYLTPQAGGELTNKVTSVNSKVGDVVLTATDVQAIPEITSKNVGDTIVFDGTQWQARKLDTVEEMESIPSTRSTSIIDVDGEIYAWKD